LSTQTVTSGFDTWASVTGPTTPHPRESALKLRADAGQGFIWFRNPAPAGATVTSAKLVLRARGASSGSRTLQLYRIGASWQEGKLTWNNRPPVLPSTLVTKSIGTLADGDTVEVDVTSILHSWANGGPNYGIRIGTTATTTHQFYALNSSRPPSLVVTWSDNPSQPSDLRPSEAATSLAKPHLTFTYEDLGGNTALAAVQVQISATSSFSSPLFDSGTVETTEAGLDLAATSFGGLAVDQTVYWRVRAMDGAGLWSVWSAPVTMTRKAKPSVTITNILNEERTNLFTDPYGEVAYSETGTPGGAATTGTVVDNPNGSGFRATAPPSGAWRSPFRHMVLEPSKAYTIRFTVRSSATQSLPFYIRRASSVGLTAGQVSLGTVAAVANTTQEVVFQFTTTSSAWDSDAAGLTIGASTGAFSPGSTVVIDGVTVREGTHSAAAMAPFAGTTSMGPVFDPTPPIVWEVTGGSQHRYRVLVDHVTEPDRWVYDSGVIQSSDNTHTITSGLRDDRTYRVRVRVWDAETREATPGDPPYREASARFYLDTDAVVSPVSDLTIRQDGVTPYVILEWQRSSTPDRFAIVRDGAIAVVDGAELFVSGTTYRYRSYYAAPNQPTKYEVRAIVNERTSQDNPSATFTTRVEGLWLVDRDRKISVTLWGDEEGSWDAPDDASEYMPVGGSRVVRIVSGVRGLEGSLSGLLMDGFGKSFAEQERDLYALKERPYQTVQLYAGDMSLEALIGNIVIAPSPRTRRGQRVKHVSFDFWQVGALPFSATI
jgi:hypothetical protein